MRTRQRTAQTFYYRLYSGKTEIVDDYGNSLGEYAVQYAAPVECRANISPATGESAIEPFGSLDNYDKVIQTCDMRIPIDENSVLYIDKSPVYSETTGEWNAHDYVVKRIARSVNTVRIAVSKVTVTTNGSPVISA